MSDRIIFGNHDCGHMVSVAVGHFYNPRSDVVIARLINERMLAGGILFTNFTGESMQVHVAGFQPRWLSRDLLWISFDYPFHQLRCARLFAQMQATNAAALKFNLGLGFREVARIEGVYPQGVAAVVTVMEEAECRFLRMRPRNYVPAYSMSKEG